MNACHFYMKHLYQMKYPLPFVKPYVAFAICNAKDEELNSSRYEDLLRYIHGANDSRPGWFNILFKYSIETGGTLHPSFVML